MTPYLVDVDDYRMKLVTGLTESWRLAKQHIHKAQQKQKKSYDCNTKTKSLDFREGDRVMVFMPQEVQGKDRKLAPPHHGPYRILEVQPNCVRVRPVDKPADHPILVSMDRVTKCPKELPDTSWLGPARKRSYRRQKRARRPLAPLPLQTHSYHLRNRDKARGRT